MDKQKIIAVLEDLLFEDINQDDYWKAVKEAKIIIKDLKQQCNIANVSNMLCGSFDLDTTTSSATKCKCGREKWEHPKAT